MAIKYTLLSLLKKNLLIDCLIVEFEIFNLLVKYFMIKVAIVSLEFMAVFYFLNF